MKRRSHVLQQLLRGFVQRRSHEVLVDSLPDKSEHVVEVRLSPIQERLYRAVRSPLCHFCVLTLHGSLLATWNCRSRSGCSSLARL